MFQNNKKAAFLELPDDHCGYSPYGNCHKQCFRYVRYGNRRLFRYCDPGKRVDGGSRAGRHPTVDHKLKSEYPAVSDRNEAQWIPVCEKGTGGRNLPVILLAVLPAFDIAGNDLLLAAVYGGVIQGIGIGLVFLGRGTTGGTDMMAALLQRKLRHYSIAQIMQFIDGAIVLVGMYVFGVQKALYAIIAVYLVTKVSDSLIEGLKFSKQAYIITSKPDEISREIMDKLDRGVTGVHGKGMYSGQDKLLLYCVVGRKEIVALKELVDHIDPDAFVIVSDVREVHGEGFIERK